MATLAPSLVLSSVVAGASTAVLSDRNAPDEQRREHSIVTGLGVSGRAPEQDRISSRVLGQAAHPGDFAQEVEPELRPPEGSLNIPVPVLDAYRGAADHLAGSRPDCGLDWSVLASIGRIESGHARSGRVDERGVASPPIIGPRLTGAGRTTAVPDTDRGVWDGDPVWDRASGPMQFLPATWRQHGADGNGDGAADPHNVRDATRAAGEYLCSTGEDLRDPGGLATAVFQYNHSERYVRAVLLWADAYGDGAVAPEVEPPPAVAARPSTKDYVPDRHPPREPAVVAMPSFGDPPSASAPVPRSDDPVEHEPAPSGAVPPEPSVPPEPNEPVAPPGTTSDSPPEAHEAPESTTPPAAPDTQDRSEAPDTPSTSDGPEAPDDPGTSGAPAPSDPSTTAPGGSTSSAETDPPTCTPEPRSPAAPCAANGTGSSPARPEQPG